MEPIEIRLPTPQQAYAALLLEEQRQAESTRQAQERKDREQESAESIAWKMRARQLLEEGRSIYGSDSSTQSEFSQLVSQGEEARLKRFADYESKLVRRYAAMSPAAMWAWAAFRGLYLYAVFGLLLWFGLIIAGTPVWAAILASALFVAFLIVQRKRWMSEYAAKATTESI